jgi:LPS O-antigen subunit length determinant protein (WzzB/FepE family)
MDEDRSYPLFVIDTFLKDASEYLVKNNLEIINSKLNYFETELAKAESFELRKSISGIISKIIEEKVMTKSKRYYQCDVLTTPSEPYIKDKAKPKRALILVVAFITSIILGIFIVFFREFLKNSEEEK